MKRFFPAFAALVAACGSVPGIPVYKMEIQQGNYVSQEMVSRLKPGMTRDQVRFVLGTPLVADAFHTDRWDYVFVRQRAKSRDVEHRRISIFFEDGRLRRVEGDVVAAVPGPGAASGAAPAKPD